MVETIDRKGTPMVAEVNSQCVCKQLREKIHKIKSPVTALAILLEIIRPGQVISEEDYMVIQAAMEELLIIVR